MACEPTWAQVTRKSFMVIHHSTAARSSQSKHLNCPFAYDAEIYEDGSFLFGDAATASVGCHASSCNTCAFGVDVQGCFGGCVPPNGPTVMSVNQICRLGYMMNCLGIPKSTGKLRPHMYCDRAQPCGSHAQTSTVCCGTTYTNPNRPAGHYWNAGAGEQLRGQIVGKAVQWGQCGYCVCPP